MEDADAVFTSRVRQQNAPSSELMSKKAARTARMDWLGRLIDALTHLTEQVSRFVARVRGIYGNESFRSNPNSTQLTIGAFGATNQNWQPCYLSCYVLVVSSALHAAAVLQQFTPSFHNCNHIIVSGGDYRVCSTRWPLSRIHSIPSAAAMYPLRVVHALSLLTLSCLSFSTSASPPSFSSLPYFSRPLPYSSSLLSASNNPYLSQLSNGTYDHQTVDHFGWSLSTQRWSQRYLYSTEHWLSPSAPNGPGPIFLYAGNEGPIETFAGNSGWMFELAQSFNAMLVFVEHRFYGRSMPWEGNATLSYANVTTLSLLTSEQAIADYVQFVDWMRGGGHETEVGPFSQCRGNCSSIPVIVFGGSYGGMLAAWYVNQPLSSSRAARPPSRPTNLLLLSWYL